MRARTPSACQLLQQPDRQGGEHAVNATSALRGQAGTFGTATSAPLRHELHARSYKSLCSMRHAVYSSDAA